MSFGEIASWVQITEYRFMRLSSPKDLLCV